MNDVPDAELWCPDCGTRTLHHWAYVYLKDLSERAFYACVCCNSAARFLADTTVEEFYGKEALA